jgi:hypothetical protein
VTIPTDPGGLAIYSAALFTLGGALGVLAGAILMLRWCVRTLEDDS